MKEETAKKSAKKSSKNKYMTDSEIKLQTYILLHTLVAAVKKIKNDKEKVEETFYDMSNYVLEYFFAESENQK